MSTTAQAAGADSRPDAFGQRSSTSLVSFHGSSVNTAAAFSHFICVIHIKAAPYTFFSVLSPHSGTSGEDQAPSEPFSGLSKQIEGLQHLKARPRVSPSRFWLVSVLKRSQLGDWLQSILQHENLCKETARCEARKSCIASQRETDRKTGPPSLLHYFLPRLLWEWNMHVTKIVLKFLATAVTDAQETGCTGFLCVRWCVCVWVRVYLLVCPFLVHLLSRLQ